MSGVGKETHLAKNIPLPVYGERAKAIERSDNGRGEGRLLAPVRMPPLTAAISLRSIRLYLSPQAGRGKKYAVERAR